MKEDSMGKDNRTTENQYAGKIRYEEGEDNVGLVKRLMWDIPENFGDGMDIPEQECACPQLSLRRAAAMCRKMFLGFYLNTDYNMAFYKMIEYFFLSGTEGDGYINSRIFRENEWQLSLWASEINKAVHFRFDTWLLENGQLSQEREETERRELDINIILWMADVYVLLSWAYKIPFCGIPCFDPRNLYESYRKERFMEVTVYDAVKLIYARHYMQFVGTWEQRALDGFNPGF